ncbi:hypothetical protein U5640_36555 [Streptomyces sp. SS7]|uniref:hypothetical protein n=1 Tax=unclassified Streptomyces TaxID=2593676 RepID=UPI00037C5603|nr:hypothetical protein [Streptomyces sp. 351MFTsu5.1]
MGGFGGRDNRRYLAKFSWTKIVWGSSRGQGRMNVGGENLAVSAAHPARCSGRGGR